MITRTFLFLLAMVTGFSAANAAEGARAVPSEIGASATVALLTSVIDDTAGISHTAACVFCEKPAILAAVTQPAIYAALDFAAPTSCTYRGDRTRE
jgi:hypothetical protein